MDTQFCQQNSTTLCVDDSDPTIEWSTGWGHLSGDNILNMTAHGSYAGTYAMYPFKGTHPLPSFTCVL